MFKAEGDKFTSSIVDVIEIGTCGFTIHEYYTRRSQYSDEEANFNLGVNFSVNVVILFFVMFMEVMSFICNLYKVYKKRQEKGNAKEKGTVEELVSTFDKRNKKRYSYVYIPLLIVAVVLISVLTANTSRLETEEVFKIRTPHSTTSTWVATVCIIFFMNGTQIVFTIVFLCHPRKDVSGFILWNIVPLLTIGVGSFMTVYLTVVDPSGDDELLYSLPILLMSLLSVIELFVDTVTYTATTYESTKLSDHNSEKS